MSAAPPSSPRRGGPEEESEQGPPPRRGWLSWGLIAAAAAAGLWLAALPLDQIVPEQRPRRALTTDPPPADASPPDAAEPDAAEAPGDDDPPRVAPAPIPDAEAIDPPATTPSAEWVETTPLPEDETPAQAALRDRLERQLAMNDLAGVRIEIAGDRVITRGALPHAGDRQRVALLVRSIAPELVHEDRAEVAGDR